MALAWVSSVPALAACAPDAAALADTTALQVALDRLKRVSLESRRTYCITHRLRVPNEGGLIGDGTATLAFVGRPVPHPSRQGDIQVDVSQARYGDDAVVIDASGETHPPYRPNRSVLLKGFRIDASLASQAYLDGIVARNADRLTISGIEIVGLPMGTGIKVASLGSGSRIENNHVHDAYSNADFRRTRPHDLPQLTGIEVDNDLVNGRGSSDLAIVGNRIERLKVGPRFRDAHGPQTDGINVANAVSARILVADNDIAHVHEGIDFFGRASVIERNRIRDAGLFGIKLIHGAQDNLIRENNLLRVSLAGIVLSGSASASTPTSHNLVLGNRVVDVDPDGRFAGNDTSCILLTDNGQGGRGMLVEANRFVRNVLDPGPRGKWIVLAASSTGADNVFVDNEMVRPGVFGTVLGVESSAVAFRRAVPWSSDVADAAASPPPR